MNVQNIYAHSISQLYAHIAVFATATHGHTFGFITKDRRFIEAVSEEIAEMFSMANIPLDYRKDNCSIYFPKTNSRIIFIDPFYRNIIHSYEFHSVFIDERINHTEEYLLLTRIRQETSYFPNQILRLEMRYRHG